MVIVPTFFFGFLGVLSAFSPNLYLLLALTLIHGMTTTVSHVRLFLGLVGTGFIGTEHAGAYRNGNINAL